ncbi:hypothetical protein PV05_07126 [Exophiala xenobiotica]|uniref:Uncharacterized protein n=1 Tax=Exophiala xenobiotica TaxID=348802 RepID=A0A0D2EJB7_9EURO|nr:uncharacterized protein PV05_07126 [Exophiala xenobiotica]KIW54790.1 hypothetical protein PV05_07126 [Exophiala xenobiotica]
MQLYQLNSSFHVWIASTCGRLGQESEGLCFVICVTLTVMERRGVFRTRARVTHCPPNPVYAWQAMLRANLFTRLGHRDPSTGQRLALRTAYRLRRESLNQASYTPYGGNKINNIHHEMAME